MLRVGIIGFGLRGLSILERFVSNLPLMARAITQILPLIVKEMEYVYSYIYIDLKSQEDSFI
ncbi:hypothetical protein [Campylobacter coli]|uniref:hypothetical protein n=1 Tax=Campylobacter coli TaxID=195 RepID=UPI00092EF37A|nr:hypothetical protein [Campylobacter coli]HEB7545985.1 hypothetical protein [Campylobacter coli]HEB7551559.1 hypothetical protein [Campylobacter coli]